MAIIKCPNCGQEISDRAQKCIHCGHPIAAQGYHPSTVNSADDEATRLISDNNQPQSAGPVVSRNSYEPAQQPDNRNRLLVIISAVAAIVIGALAGYFVLSHNRDNNVPNPIDVANTEFVPFSASDILLEAESNVEATKNKYKDAYIEVTGLMGALETDGQHFTLLPTSDSTSLAVHCAITDPTQKQEVLKATKNDTLIVKCQVIDVDGTKGFVVNTAAVTVSKAVVGPTPVPEPTPAPEPKPEPAPDPNRYSLSYSNSQYFIQAGSWPSLSEARSYKNERGGHICKVKISGKGIWYRLLLGPFSDEYEAEYTADNLYYPTLVISGKHVRKDCIYFTN